MDCNNYFMNVNIDQDGIVLAEDQRMEGDVVLEENFGDQDARPILEVMYGPDGEAWFMDGNLRDQLAQAHAEQIAEMVIFENNAEVDDAVFIAAPVLEDMIIFDNNEDEADDHENYMFFDGRQ